MGTIGDINAVLSLYQSLGPYLTPIVFGFWAWGRYSKHRRQRELGQLKRELIERDNRIMYILSSVGIVKKTGRVDLASWGDLLSEKVEEGESSWI